MAGGTLALDNTAVLPDAPTIVSNREGSDPSNTGETELGELSFVGGLLEQAERRMDSLKSRVSYLERRAASSIGATARELEDLMWARDELAASAARVAHFSGWHERPTGEESDGYLEWEGWN